MPKALTRIPVLLFAILGVLTMTAAADPVRVFAAASLTDALKEIGALYEAGGGGKVELNFAASSTLARQIQEGAPADVFFSADEAKMDALSKAGLIDDATRASLLSNALVLVIPSDSTLEIKDLASIAQPRVQRIALADPKSVPAGIYARELLEKNGLWEQVKDRVVPTENVRAALAAVDSGNVDAGIVYRTDASISKSVKVAFEVPAEAGPVISYPCAVLKSSPDPAAATRFLAFLKSKPALDVFAKLGFIVRS